MQQARKVLKDRKEIPGHKGLKETLERGVRKALRVRRVTPEQREQKEQQVRKDRQVQLLQLVLMGTGIWVLLILGNLPEGRQAHRARKEILGRKAHKDQKEILERLEQKALRERKDPLGRLLPSVLMGIGI